MFRRNRLDASFIKYRVDNSGATLALTALLMPVLILGAGAGIDYARIVSAQSTLQQMADEGALAGARVFAGSKSDWSKIGEKVKSFIIANSDDAAFGWINVIDTKVGVDKANYQVTVSMSATVDTSLIGVFGVDKVAFTRSSTARVGIANITEEGNNKLCVLALDPSAQNAIYFKGSGEVDSPDCVFYANSSMMGQAQMFQGSFTSVAHGYCSVGDHTIQNANVIPRPTDFCDAVADPLAGWTPPSVPETCDYGVVSGSVVGVKINSSGDHTLYPGRYCGDVSILSGGTVTFAPGRYFFTDGSIQFNSSGNVVADGVYLHFGEGTKTYSISATTNLRLSASGDSSLNNVVLYMDPSLVLSQKTSISGKTDLYISGTVYMLGDQINISGKSVVRIDKTAMALIGKTVSIEGGGRLEISPDPNLYVHSSGSEMVTSVVRLVK